MTRGGDRRDRDSDDWFIEPEPFAQSPTQRTSQGEAAAQAHEDAPVPADDWLASDLASNEHGSRPGSLDRVGFAAAALLLALFAGLAIAGVFTSAHYRPRAPVTTTPRSPTATATTTTTVATTTTTHSSVALPTSTLKPGDTGAQVTDLQRTLTGLGYSTGAADGNYGPATQSAVARFQRASGITSDGIFGSQTLSALKRGAG
jgi:hypothetical protein